MLEGEMADFREVPGQPITYLSAVESFIMFPDTFGDVALWGGGPNGEVLSLYCWDDKIVDVTDITYVASPLGDNMRRIQLKAQNTGLTVVEARLGVSGPAWARVGVAVGMTPSQSPLQSLGQSSDTLKAALTAFESTAVNFAARFIPDARVRANYVRQAEAASREIEAEVLSGAKTAEEGARKANEMRNALLETARLQSSDVGRAVAEAEKATGLGMEELQAKYAARLFGKEFGELAAAEQDAVFLEIVRAAGRPNARFNALAARLGKAGKGLLVVSIAFAAYNVASSDRPGREAVKQGAGMGIGFLGSVGGGAAAGLVCGPGAPVCVGVGALVGGILFAVGSDYAFDWLWK
jgi:hypothetical protein